MGIREDLQAMGFPADLVSAACFKFPNNPDRAADFALNPPPNWQLTAARDAGNWDPLPSPRTDQPYVPWTDPPSNTNDNWALVPSSNSNRNRRQSPPPSRPEPLPSYHADSQVQSGPAQLVSRNHLSGGNTAQEDDELAKAIAMSMSQSAPIPQQEPFQTTWSHPTESMDDSTPAPATWSHHEYAQQEQQPSRTQFPNPDSAALDALVASAMRDITTEPNSFHDDMQERSLRDEIRAKSPHAPVELRVPARHLLALPTLVQALYADAHFRNALLALPLHFTSQEQSYNGFSKGSMSPTLAPQEISDLTLARQLRILKSLQRLFVFMRHTKRRRIAIVDLCGALEGSYDNRHLQDWPDAKVALSALRDIMEAWMNAIQHIHLTSKVDRAWQRIRDVPMTSGRPGQTPNTSIGDLSESPPAEELSIPQIPLDLSTSTTHLYDAIESAFAHSGCYIVQQPETMIMSLDRSNLPQSQTHILTLVKTLQMDRALWKNRFTVLHAIKQKEEMQQKKETIEKEKERVQNIHGKDLLQALEVSVKYFDFHAKPTDDTHAAKQQSMKEQLRRLLDDLKAKLAEKNNELTRIESEATLLMESSNLQDPDAAYELVGIVSSTGFESSNMMFGYFQTDDGEWYKQLDRKVEHSNSTCAVEDSAGSWMRAGPYILIYGRKSIAPLEVTDEPQNLVNDVIRDNYRFKEELAHAPELTTEDWDLPPRPPTPIHSPSKSSPDLLEDQSVHQNPLVQATASSTRTSQGAMDLDTNEASTLVPLNSEFGRDREEEIGSGVVEKSSQS